MNNENEQKQQGLQIELTPDKAQVRSRVILAPEHAKRLLGALQENIMRYERTFGQIKMPQPSNEGRTIAPFNVKGGEA